MKRIALLITIACFALTNIARGQYANQQGGAVGIGSEERLQRLRYRQDQTRWEKAKKITTLDKKDWPLSGKSTIGYLSKLKKDEPQKIETHEMEVLSVMDDQSLLLITVLEKDVIWLEKYDTSDFVDGDDVRILGYIMPRGTKEYTTAGGRKKTVRVVELLSPDVSMDLDAKRQAKEDDEAEKRELAQYPEWTLKDGTKFRAQLETFQGNSARFILMGSQEPSVKRIVDFNQDDADKLRDLLVEHKKTERAAARARRK